MNKTKILIFLLLTYTLFVSGEALSSVKPVIIKIKNNSSINYTNKTILLDLNKIKKENPSFDPDKYEIKINNEVQFFEVINNNSIALSIDLMAGEEKKLAIVYSKSPVKFKPVKRTQAFLGEKKNYTLKDKYYTEGNFESVIFARVPKDHFAHDALYQYEGPGWESENAAYRIYLDSRNRIDLFGKKVSSMILHEAGKSDLVSDSKESYTKMQDWGMDIFKVGNSLGMGSFGAYINKKVITVSETDSTYCSVTNNNSLFSSVQLKYFGWNTGKNKVDLTSHISIEAGSKLSRIDLKSSKEIPYFCAGLAIHENTEIVKSALKNGWNYLAIWGKQALSGDNLGIALIFNGSEFTSLNEDEFSHFIISRPSVKRISYYITYAWEQDKEGIKTKEDFVNYLNYTVLQLNNPIIIKY